MCFVGGGEVQWWVGYLVMGGRSMEDGGIPVVGRWFGGEGGGGVGRWNREKEEKMMDWGLVR